MLRSGRFSETRSHGGVYDSSADWMVGVSRTSTAKFFRCLNYVWFACFKSELVSSHCPRTCILANFNFILVVCVCGGILMDHLLTISLVSKG